MTGYFLDESFWLLRKYGRGSNKNPMHREVKRTTAHGRFLETDDSEVEVQAQSGCRKMICVAG